MLVQSMDFDDAGREEEDDQDQFHEVKYSPPIEVKQEIIDDCPCEDIKDEEDNLTESSRSTRRNDVKNDNYFGEKSWRDQPQRELRKRVNKQIKESAVVEDGKDSDWVPDEDDDWVLSKSKRRRSPSKKSTTRKKLNLQSGKGNSRKEQFVREDKVKSKELVTGKNTSKGKRISDMTPERADSGRARWRDEKGKEQRRQSEKSENTEESVTERTPSPGKRKRLKICEMTQEQADRERARLHAKREREKMRKEVTPKNEVSEQSDASCVKPPGRRKKRVADMTPEELKVYREKERERSKRRREREKNISDPEKRKEFEERYAAKLEKLKLKRALAKEGALPKEDLAKIEKQKRKDRERRQAKRAAMSAEERREELQRNKFYKLNLMARLSEEEKSARRIRKYMEAQAKLAEMDPEQRKLCQEKRKIHNREAARRKAAKMKTNPKVLDEQTLKQLREKKRLYWQNMQPERKAVYLAKLRDYHKKKMEVWRETGEWEQIKERMRERSKLNQRKRRASGLYQKQKGKGQNSGVRAPRRRVSELSEEEKEIVRRRRREYTTRRKLAVQKLLDMGMSFEEIQQRTETSEQREHRIIRKRVQKAKSTLRKQLEGQGLSAQEIQKRCEQLKETFQTEHKVRPYKPQPVKWKPPAPEEVAKLKEEGLDNVENLKPFSLVITNSAASSTPRRRRKRRTIPSKPPQQQSQQQEPRSPRKHATPVISSSPSLGVIIKREEPPTEQKSSSQIQPSLVSLPATQQQYQQGQYSQHQIVIYSQQQPITIYQISSEQQQLIEPCNINETLNSTSYPAENASFSTFVPVNNDDCYKYAEQVTGSHNQNSTATDSQYDDYGSNYYEDDGNDDYSLAPVGAEENNECDISSAQTQPLKSMSPQPPPPVTTTKVTSRKRRAKILKPKESKPRGAKKSSKSIRDVVCDQCGESYNKHYITPHKNQMHNPNYDSQTRVCRLCGVVYPNTQRWYKHYLRDHQNTGVVVEKSHICEECGSTFVSKPNLVKHQYFAHGEGQNKDNYIQCPVCPDKSFKGKVGYNAHLQRYHPALLSTGFTCYRCNEKFSNWMLIRQHVKTVHPDSHFPCPYCTVTKFSQLGLYFHFRRCTKINGADRNAMRRKCEQEGGVFSLEEMRLPCEFCEKLVIVSGLTRHYQEFHNVKEDKFTCSVCQKEFTTRGFWGNHLEEKHQWPVDDLKELLRKLNAANREGLTTHAKRSQYARPSESISGARRRRKIKTEQFKGNSEEKTRDKKFKKCNSKLSSGSEKEVEVKKEIKQEWNSDHEHQKVKRKIIVIAEEDEMAS